MPSASGRYSISLNCWPPLVFVYHRSSSYSIRCEDALGIHGELLASSHAHLQYLQETRRLPLTVDSVSVTDTCDRITLLDHGESNTAMTHECHVAVALLNPFPTARS